MKRFKSISTFLLTVFISMSLVACGTAKQSAEKGKPIENKTKKEDTMENKIKGEDTMMPSNKDLHDRASKITTKISDIKGVDKAHVVISEKTAIVGLNINKDYEGKVTDELRKKVEDTVKNTDKDINTVTITADPNLTERIRKVGEDIGAGKPISGLGTEIKEILNRIVPR